MGRTGRKRLQRKKQTFQKLDQLNTVVLDDLKWWITQNFDLKFDLVPHIFLETGRGLMTLKDIKIGDVILELPKQMLITTFTVSQSYISKIFLSDKIYEAQCVLATFLVYEKHLETASKWKPYLDTLPASYSNPEFCSVTEKKILPEFITSHLNLVARKLKACYLSLIESLLILKNRNFLCPHCSLSFYTIITYQDFMWGYYTVNTRAVYLDNKDDIKINVKGDDLALAPFLDLFNHACATVAVATLNKKNESEFYEIKSLKSYKRGSQVLINYGSHNNLKLYTEYGFVIPQNPLDEIKFDISDIKQFINLSQIVVNFLKLHKMNDNMAFSWQGLNYNARNTLFVCTTLVQQNQWNKKIFLEKFDSEDLSRLAFLGLKILNMKKSELKWNLENMKRVTHKSQSFLVAITLVEEFLKVLENCMREMSK